MIERRRPRLKEYDYRTAGAYFITVCAYHRQCLFGSIELIDESGSIHHNLSPFGRCVERQIKNLESVFPFICIHQSVIMPNHFHLLLTLDENATRDIPFIIGRMKSLATRDSWKEGYPEKQLFQPSFYEHIVRNETEFVEIWNYIEGNPQKWRDDKYYIAP